MESNMIAISSDHGAFDLKEKVKEYMSKNGYEFKDFGTNSTDSCDYPTYTEKAAIAVAVGECTRGIVLCSTGIGASIAANKVRGIRCALCSEPFSAEMTRRHNDSNVLAMGAGIVGENLALKILEVWLTTEFDGGRHQRRVDQIMGIESIHQKER